MGITWHRESANPYKNEPLSRKVVRGGAWVFALRISNRGLGFIRMVVLARLLAPEDFGLLGIAMLAISTLDAFSQTGFQSALIQRKGNVRAYLDVAWTVLAVRGVALFLILLAAAPGVAWFFNSPQATAVIMVIAVNMFFTGFGNIGVVFFQKELEFNKQFTYELSATLVDLAVSISLAFILRNVWALVWGGLAKNCARFLLSYALHPYRPRIRFEREKFQDLFGFGIWVSGSTILIFLITQGDDIFVGKMIGVAALGLYQIAYMVSNLPVTEITDVMSRVMFPAYSKLQDNVTRLREAYLRVLQVTASITIPFAAGIYALSAEFTGIVLGQKWIPMVPAIKVLALAGLVSSITATTRPVFYGVGKPKIDTVWHVVRLMLLAAVLYPLSMRWGIAGAAAAVLVSSVFSAVGFKVNALRIIACDFKSYGKMILPPLINSVLMVVIVTLLKESIGCAAFWQFLILVGAGLTSYLTFTYLCERFFKYGITKVIGELFASL